MRVAWLYHEEFLRHTAGRMHPERPERLRAVVEAIERQQLGERAVRPEIERVEAAELSPVHDPQYVRFVAEAWERGVRTLDAGDTRINEHSYEAALRAAGGAFLAADGVIDGRWGRAFATMRPPGHHAEHDRAMGFCLFNNIALAAHHLTDVHGLERVAIVDFDVHHGNGTQHIFERRADVLYVSVHQDPDTLFPGTGFASETGKEEGEGFTLNVPLPPGGGDAEWREAFEQSVLPRVDRHEPQMVLLSAGFDAAAEDPLAQMNVTNEGFRWISERLVETAERHCGGRVISFLEGGYDLEAVARDATTHLRVLMGDGA